MNNLDQYNTRDKSLPDLFKEVQDIRYGRAKPKETINPMNEVKFNRICVVDKKFNVIGAIVGCLLVIMFFTLVNSNSIFATSEEEKYAIGEFEENQFPIEIMQVISSNISSTTTKEIITSEIELPYEVTYTDNSQLPLGEDNIIQNGRPGYMDQTVIKTYENGELINENVISEIRKTEPIVQIVEVGTSQFLHDKQAHIGDVLYTTEDVNMYKEPNESEEEKICMIYQNIDVKMLSDQEGWAYVTVDGLEGYVKNEFITSENVTPGVAELCRKKRLLLSVKPEMEVNKPSGLTREDFIKVLSNHEQDEDKIIENCAETFYEAEQKYNVNGLFLASIGIHESNWGRSNIAKQKQNLFGYGSYDSSAFESSYTFESYQYGIDLVAKVLAKYYLNERGTLIYDGELAAASYYNGPTIEGVNVRYASDENWSNRVYSIMKSLYESL